MLDKFKKLVKSSDFVYSDDVYDDFVKNYDKINSNLKLKKIKMVLSAEELSKNGFDKSGSFNVLLVGSVFYLFFLISILLHFIIAGFTDFIYGLFDWEVTKFPFLYLVFLVLGFFVSMGGYKRRQDNVNATHANILKEIKKGNIKNGFFFVFELYNKKCVSFVYSKKKISFPATFGSVIKK